MPLRVMFVAGEASGDLHGSGVVRELKRCRPDSDLFGMGGDLMQREGMEVVRHIAAMSFMGFVEVIRNLPAIRRAGSQLRALLDSRRPDVVVLIDYPGFNLRFARRVKQRGIPVLYYISPQVWAWNRRRVKVMRSRVDAMKVVFPFEVPIYEKEGVRVEFVGHPLAERIRSDSSRDAFCQAYGLDPAGRLLALFPGSRMQELERVLPVIAGAALQIRSAGGVQVVIGVAPNIGAAAVRRFLPAGAPVTLVEQATYELMHHADAAIVTSGTATLETGWFGTPMVVVYRTSAVSFFIGRLLVDVPYIGLVNIVAGKKVVPELLQSDMTVGKVAQEAGRLLNDPDYAGSMRRELSVIRSRLGSPGASARVAQGILSLAGAS